MAELILFCGHHFPINTPRPFPHQSGPLHRNLLIIKPDDITSLSLFSPWGLTYILKQNENFVEIQILNWVL